MRTIRNIGGLAAAALAVLAACSRAAPPEAPAAAAAAQEVNVYSARHYEADRAVYDRFTRDTGVKVNLIESQGDALIERLAREAEASPADLFITADAGILWRAEQRGVLQPIDDQSVLSRAPEQAVGPDGLWIGLTRRARVIVYNKDQGLPDGLKTYEDLADPSLLNLLSRCQRHLDTEALRRCLDEHTTLPKVLEDARAGARLDITSTPTVFVAGRRIKGSFEDASKYEMAVLLEKLGD